MTPLEQVKILADALRQIGAIAVETGADAMPALLEAQRIADEGLERAGMQVAEGMMMNWKPIETAPKNGTVILGCQGNGDDYQVFEMVWGDWNGGIEWRDPRYDGAYTPTYWQPRPEPPTNK
jgi:hypothetical protein